MRAALLSGSALYFDCPENPLPGLSAIAGALGLEVIAVEYDARRQLEMALSRPLTAEDLFDAMARMPIGYRRITQERSPGTCTMP